MALYIFEMPLNQSTFVSREFEWNPYDARGPVNLCQHRKLGNIFMVLLQWLLT